MVEKSVMTKSGKSKPKKQAVSTTTYEVAPVDPQVMASQKVFDAIPIAIVSVDWNGHIQYMNRAAKSLLGEPDKHLLLEAWPETFGLYLDDGVMSFPAQKLPLLRALRAEDVREPEEIILWRPGSEKEIWISMSAEMLRD